MDYAGFLEHKAQIGGMSGFEPISMPSCLFDFQHFLTEWSIRKGKSAMFADCGMGKSLCQLVWADNVVRHTNRPVLILTPLAVSHQTCQEAEKFGIEARRSRDGKVGKPSIYVTNYEQLHQFDPADFAGCVADESSILKSYDGARKKQIVWFMRKLEYRLLCTATAAPNDYHELGTSSEALGELGYKDMLSRFFKNDQNNQIKQRTFMGGRLSRAVTDETAKWRLKGHAEEAFWRWVCSWARAIRKPSDFGFDDGAFLLPALIEREHVVTAKTLPAGCLFAMPAFGLKEQREERRRTIRERCEKAAELVAHSGQPALMWCHLNAEGDLLSSLVKDGLQIAGADSDEAKEEKFEAFTSGQLRVLITKPKIGAWGLNFQHCAHMTAFPSHSFEQYYQCIRRCLRFGQLRNVEVDMVTTEGELDVIKNLQRKAVQADKMFDALMTHMNSALAIERMNAHTTQEILPSWL